MNAKQRAREEKLGKLIKTYRANLEDVNAREAIRDFIHDNYSSKTPSLPILWFTTQQLIHPVIIPEHTVQLLTVLAQVDRIRRKVADKSLGALDNLREGREGEDLEETLAEIVSQGKKLRRRYIILVNSLMIWDMFEKYASLSAEGLLDWFSNVFGQPDQPPVFIADLSPAEHDEVMGTKEECKAAVVGAIGWEIEQYDEGNFLLDLEERKKALCDHFTKPYKEVDIVDRINLYLQRVESLVERYQKAADELRREEDV